MSGNAAHLQLGHYQRDAPTSLWIVGGGVWREMRGDQLK